MRIASKLGLFAIAGFVALTAVSSAGYATGLSPATKAGGGGCPNSNAIGNFLPSSLVGVSTDKGPTTWSYFFSSLSDQGPVNGVPGLIAYCVYDGSTSPSPITVNATGADGSPWTSVAKDTSGYFAFVRGTGNPSNIELDGSVNTLMGSATWSAGAPTVQTILLHINDARECQSLYGGSDSTCFVYPAAPCAGAPACKSASIYEALSTNPITVPVNTTLHIEWTFTIVNQLSNNFDMEFPASSFPTTDPNVTGLRDVFNVGQTPDPYGSPGALGTFPNYQGTGFDLYLNHTDLLGQPVRLILTNSGPTIVLKPGESISFTVDMVQTGFNVTGWQCLNLGLNLRWVQSDDGLVHHFHGPDIDVWVVTVEACGGAPACKTAYVAEATSWKPLVVPANTVLHVAWTFTIANAASNTYNMEFPLSMFPTTDPNGTGLRDFFNCGETPDPSGNPGAVGTFANYQGTGFDLYLNQTNQPCGPERLILTNSGSAIVLTPGQTITFTINMVDPGFSVTGKQCLNFGINLRWIQSDDGLLHAYHAPGVDVWVI